jgi:hypothetical protein
MAAVPVIVALVAAIGAAVPVPRRFLPLLAIAIGVAWNSFAAAALGSISWHALLAGVVVGLAASGLYSGAVKPALSVSREVR